MYKRSFALSLALVTCFAISCGSGGGAGNSGDFNLISMEDEWQLGNQISQEVAAQVRFNNDPVLNSYIQQIGQRIVSQTPMANLPWHFYVVQDDNINAFSIPGGHVYVNTGLIQHAENASELAGVMAHEISHVVARHSTEQLSKQYGLSILAGAVLGQNPGTVQSIVASIVANGAMARFSRADEEEADKLGIGYMKQAGYDPRGMGDMFRVLLAQEKSQPGKVEQFFATHPTTTSRIADADKRAAELGSAGTVRDEPQFQDARRRA
jgi:predicted Zn-dependent protease